MKRYIFLLLLGYPLFAQTYVQSAGCTGPGTPTSISCAFGSNNTASHTIIVEEGGSPFSTPSTPTDTLGNTYVSIAQPVTGVNGRFGIWVAFSSAAGANTVTVVDGGNNLLLIVAEYTRASTFDNQGSNGTTSASSITSTTTLSKTGDLLVAGAFGQDAGSGSTTWIVSGSGWTQRQLVSAADDTSMVLWDQVYGSSGAVSVTATPSNGPRPLAGLVAGFTQAVSSSVLSQVIVF